MSGCGRSSKPGRPCRHGAGLPVLGPDARCVCRVRRRVRHVAHPPGCPHHPRLGRSSCFAHARRTARSGKAPGVPAKRCGTGAETGRKRRERGPEDRFDRFARPHRPPWKATGEGRAVVCALRCATDFAPCGLTFVVRHFPPRLNRYSIESRGPEPRIRGGVRTPRQRPGHPQRSRPRLDTTPPRGPVPDTRRPQGAPVGRCASRAPSRPSPIDWTASARVHGADWPAATAGAHRAGVSGIDRDGVAPNSGSASTLRQPSSRHAGRYVARLRQRDGAHPAERPTRPDSTSIRPPVDGRFCSMRPNTSAPTGCAGENHGAR